MTKLTRGVCKDSNNCAKWRRFTHTHQTKALFFAVFDLYAPPPPRHLLSLEKAGQSPAEEFNLHTWIKQAFHGPCSSAWQL